MQNPEDFILSHASQRVYDPVKAHAYYLRTRKLKGRRPAIAKVGAIKTSQVKSLGKVPPGTAKGTPQLGSRPITITEIRQKQVQGRVKALRAKLSILHTILNKLVSEAKSASAPAPAKRATKSVATKTRSANSPRKALTGAQKTEKAKKARAKYQKEHPQSLKIQKEQARKQKIEEVKQKIEEVSSQLKAALEHARQMSTHSQPAATGRRTPRKESQNGS